MLIPMRYRSLIITIIILLFHHKIVNSFPRIISTANIPYLGHKSPDNSTYNIENLTLVRTKRQFGRTIFDSLGGINEWQRLQNTGPQLFNNIETSAKSKYDDIPIELKDDKHRVVMGIGDSRCDDAKTMLEVDWDGSPSAYTCFTPKTTLPSIKNRVIMEKCDDVPIDYIPQHYCMKDMIKYNTSLPTFGDHRPLWPMYGEYRFLPSQRWLHNIEHGAIVMLYHPCASTSLVEQLKKIVKGCIYKHVISAYTHVSLQKPLVLISWGCKLEMSYVDKKKIETFIRERSLHGPEGTISRQGSYDFGLIAPSHPLKGSDVNDTILCPN